MALKAKHAFGSLANVDKALQDGVIDSFDILFLEDDGKATIGWINKNGQKVIVDNSVTTTVEGDTLPEVGEVGKIYIKDDEAYIYNGTEYKNISKSADLTALESQIATKVSVEEVDAKIEEALGDYVIQKYKISHKPDGTLVSYCEKEIRVMCPADTEWVLQQSGEGADKNKYYIGFKAYAPSDDVVSFKEDLAKTISDTTMYYFEGNDFAGVESDGRKYSIVWFPVAAYDETSGTWTYYGEGSSSQKYIGWYYSVEWYNASGNIVSSDCIRINLSNESCYSSVEPYYVSEIGTKIEQIESKIEEVSSYEIIEF